MDETLRIQELKDRRPGAIEALVDEYASGLLAAACSWGLSGLDAEEAVQDTLVDFLSAVERFEGRSRIKTFLFGILFNKCSERRRKSHREQASEDIDKIFEARFGVWGIWNCVPKGPEDQALNDELRRWLETCAGNLSTDQRAAFQLKVVDGQSTEEACKILGVSDTHLGVLLFRARNKLRECLEKKWIKT